MYRVLSTLSIGKAGALGPGTFTDLAWLKKKDRERLVALDKVSVVQPPPLRILPGWTRRADRFEPLGIVSVTDFLETDTKELAVRSGETGRKYKEATIAKWKREAKEWLTVTPQSGG